MQAEQRHKLIAAEIASKGSVRVADLVSLLGVSKMTIRRDLEEMERHSLLRRVHGGAVGSVSSSYEPPFAQRAVSAQPSKDRIAQAAAALIKDGDTVILDVGTTTLAVARALHGRSLLTVLTPSLHVAGELASDPGIRLMLTGGLVRAGELSLVGPIAEAAFSELIFDALILGCGGIHPVLGVTEHNLDDARVKRQALESAQLRIVVADHSKIGNVAFARVCPLSEIDILVTNATPDQANDDIEALREHDLEVILA